MIGAGAFFCFTFSWVCGLSELLAGAILNQLDRTNLLICDEAGYLSFSRSGAELLFQVFADRYGRRSLLITSNLAFSDWGTIFEGERMTAALTDARPAVESESQEVNVFWHGDLSVGLEMLVRVGDPSSLGRYMSVLSRPWSMAQDERWDCDFARG